MTDHAGISHWKSGEPQIPFYAVIFISAKSDELDGYEAMDEHLMKEAWNQPGFLGYSSRGSLESGIFISYWQDESSIDNWRRHLDHQKAKQEAYARWYDYLHTMICKVESSKIFSRIKSAGH